MQADYIGERNLCAAVIGAAFRDLDLWQNRLDVVKAGGINPNGYRRRIQRAADAFLDMDSDLQYFASDKFQWMCAFTGMDGVYVKREDTVRSFKAIIDGDVDDLPLKAFQYVGTIDDAKAKAKTLMAEV